MVLASENYTNQFLLILKRIYGLIALISWLLLHLLKNPALSGPAKSHMKLSKYLVNHEISQGNKLCDIFPFTGKISRKISNLRNC